MTMTTTTDTPMTLPTITETLPVSSSDSGSFSGRGVDVPGCLKLVALEPEVADAWRTVGSIVVLPEEEDLMLADAPEDDGSVEMFPFDMDDLVAADDDPGVVLAVESLLAVVAVLGLDVLHEVGLTVARGFVAREAAAALVSLDVLVVVVVAWGESFDVDDVRAV